MASRNNRFAFIIEIGLSAVMLTGFPLRRNLIAAGLEAALPHPAGIALRPEFFARDFFTIFVFAAVKTLLKCPHSHSGENVPFWFN
jgi:hypothetical protein